MIGKNPDPLSIQYQKAIKAQNILNEISSDLKNYAEELKLATDEMVANVLSADTTKAVNYREPSLIASCDVIDEIIKQISSLSDTASSLSSSVNSAVTRIKTVQDDLAKKANQ